MYRRLHRVCAIAALQLALAAASAAAQSSLAGDPIRMSRADGRELGDLDRLEKLDRQFFVKLSYAIQR